MDEFAAYLGIDWADTKHDLCLLDATSGAETRLVIRHGHEARAEYFTALRALNESVVGALQIDNLRWPSYWRERPVVR